MKFLGEIRDYDLRQEKIGVRFFPFPMFYGIWRWEHKSHISFIGIDTCNDHKSELFQRVARKTCTDSGIRSDMFESNKTFVEVESFVLWWTIISFYVFFLLSSVIANLKEKYWKSHASFFCVSIHRIEVTSSKHKKKEEKRFQKAPSFSNILLMFKCMMRRSAEECMQPSYMMVNKREIERRRNRNRRWWKES